MPDSPPFRILLNIFSATKAQDALGENISLLIDRTTSSYLFHACSVSKISAVRLHDLFAAFGGSSCKTH